MDDKTNQQPVQQPQPIQPVSGGKKEMPPLGSEWVSASSPEIVLPKEVQEVGVEVQPTVPTVQPSAQAAGVQHAKEATPVSAVKAEPLNLATPRSVLNHLKNAHKSWKDAMSWFVRLIIKEQDKQKNHPTESRYS